MELFEVIKEGIKDFNLNQYAFINPKELVFSPDVRKYCEQNYCGKYGTNWQCPPGAGDIRVLEAKIKSYNYGLMFNTVTKLMDSYDFEGMMQAKDNFTTICLKIQEVVLNVAKDGYALGAGGCNLCEPCSYPDKPCRFPEKTIASIEACGVDVHSSSSKLGFKYINGQNTVTYFGLVVFMKL